MPVEISIQRVQSETLLSALSESQIVFVHSSMFAQGASKSVGSPSKLGSGFPSPMYVWMKRAFPLCGFVYAYVKRLQLWGFPLSLFRIESAKL